MKKLYWLIFGACIALITSCGAGESAVKSGRILPVDAVVTFASSASFVDEDSTGHVITVELSATTALTTAVSVDIQDTLAGTAGANIDYTFASPQTVTFSAGSVSGATQDVALIPVDDLDIEGTETINLAFANPSGATLGSVSTHNVTIDDDDGIAVNFVQPSSTVGETGGTLDIEVVLSSPGGPLASAVTVDVIDSTGGTALVGLDYTTSANPQTLTFAIGATTGTTATASLTAVDDILAEGDETIFFQLGNVTGGAVIGSQINHVVTLTDDDTVPSVEFDMASGIGDENTDQLIELVLNVPAGGTLSFDITVTVEDTLLGSATENTDYTSFGSEIVTFSTGSVDGQKKTITLHVINDLDVEGNETVEFEITNISSSADIGAISEHTATIQDDDASGLLVKETGVTGNDIINGGDYYFGRVALGSTDPVLTVYLANTTASVVTLTTPSLTGANTIYSIDTTGFSTTLMPSASTSFTITLSTQFLRYTATEDTVDFSHDATGVMEDFSFDLEGYPTLCFDVVTSERFVVIHDRSQSMDEASSQQIMMDYTGTGISSPSKMDVFKTDALCFLKSLESTDCFAWNSFGGNPEQNYEASLLEANSVHLVDTEADIIALQSEGWRPVYTALSIACSQYGTNVDQIILILGDHPDLDSGAPLGFGGATQILADFPGWYAALQAAGCQLVCVYIGDNIDGETFMQTLATQNGGVYYKR